MSNKTYKTGVGCGVVLVRGNKILLGKRHDDPEKADSELHGEGSWCIPGGKIDYRETFTDGVCREALEETGIKLKKDALQFVSLCSDIVEDAHFVTAGFICTDFEGEPKIMEPDEVVKWKWFEKDELPTPMYSASLKVIEHWKEGNIFNMGD